MDGRQVSRPRLGLLTLAVGAALVMLLAAVLGRSGDPVPDSRPATQYGAGDHELALTHGGEVRRYWLHVPASHDPSTPVPLVLVFHGAGGSADVMRSAHGWVRKSDAEGFLVAFPNGASRLDSGALGTWNAGACCGYAMQSRSDDIGFTAAIVDEARSWFSLRAVFAAGMSNGGMFAHRLACERPDLVTAIASVAGTNATNACDPDRPVSVLQIHSLQDERVPFEGGCGATCEGGAAIDHTSVPETMAGWAARNGCQERAERTSINEQAYTDTYANCRDGVLVRLIVTLDGGHSWPGSGPVTDGAERSVPSTAISATDEAWAFFAAAASP